MFWQENFTMYDYRLFFATTTLDDRRAERRAAPGGDHVKRVVRLAPNRRSGRESGQR